MKVAIKKVLDYCAKEKIETIICCGDLASKETLDFLNDNFSGTIYYSFGNMDNEQLRHVPAGEKYKNTIISKYFGEAEIRGKKVAFVHFPEEAKKLCQSGQYELVFHGHTHKPWEENIGECKMLNPGNVAGEIYPPTFAVWETNDDKFNLVRIHGLK
jgi:putative phosphoesterase